MSALRPDLPSDPSPGQPLGAEVLLRETGWLRRLARAMTIDDAAADDLVQDVVADVLAAPPRVAPSSVRAWLRTVLRRRAGREWRQREVAVCAEREAARPVANAPLIDEDERLRLHEELAREVRELDPEDRHLLVRRYFDGIPPRALAGELGVSPAAARQRLSRALSRLRQRLGRTERGAERWSLALVGLAQPPAPPASVPVPESAPLPSSTWRSSTWKLAAMTTPQFLVAAGLAGVALVVTVALRTAPDTQVVTEVALERPVPASSDAIAGPKQERRARALVPTAERSDEQPAPPAERAAPTLRIVGPRDTPVDARAAWVDETGEARSVELSAEGRAERPTAGSFRLFVAAPDCVAYHEVVDAPGDVVVRLRPAPVIDGVVTVDGGAPGWRIRFGFMGSGGDEDTGVEDWEDGLERRLKSLGALSEQREFETDENGRFRLAVTSPHERLRLWLPSGHVAMAGRRLELSKDRSSATLEVDVREVGLDLVTVPLITGRYVWDDDGSPVQGLLCMLRRDERGYMVDGMRHARLGPDGRFTIGVDERLDEPRAIDPAAPDETLAQRFLGERAHDVRIYVDSPSFVPDSERSFEVAGDSFPIDVGDIRIPRPPRTTVRVLARHDEALRPVRAVVRAPGASATTDDDGRATVQAGPGAYLDVLARGHGFRRVRVPDEAIEDALEILLEPAPTLTVRYPADWSEGPFELRPIVRLSYDEPPYGEWPEVTDDPPVFHHHHHSRLYGTWRSGLSMTQTDWTEFALDAEGAIEIHGLRAGATFEVAMFDCFRRALASETVTFEGATTIDFAARDLSLASLVCTVTTAEGEEVTDGGIGLHGDDWSSYRAVEGSTVELGVLVPAPCKISFRSGEHGVVEPQEIGLHPGENARTFVLVPPEDDAGR
ncbi:MAG: sigma-70 family RNA polymerase sigma factor [Planctomycetota bacterium]